MTEPKSFNKPLIAPIARELDTFTVICEILGIITVPLGMLYLAVAMYYYARKHRLQALKDHTKDNSHWRIL